jgi:hypothetical protein
MLRIAGRKRVQPQGHLMNVYSVLNERSIVVFLKFRYPLLLLHLVLTKLIAVDFDAFYIN